MSSTRNSVLVIVFSIAAVCGLAILAIAYAGENLQHVLKKGTHQSNLENALEERSAPPDPDVADTETALDTRQISPENAFEERSAPLDPDVDDAEAAPDTRQISPEFHFAQQKHPQLTSSDVRSFAIVYSGPDNNGKTCFTLEADGCISPAVCCSTIWCIRGGEKLPCDTTTHKRITIDLNTPAKSIKAFAREIQANESDTVSWFAELLNRGGFSRWRLVRIFPTRGIVHEKWHSYYDVEDRCNIAFQLATQESEVADLVRRLRNAGIKPATADLLAMSTYIVLNRPSRDESFNRKDLITRVADVFNWTRLLRDCYNVASTEVVDEYCGNSPEDRSWQESSKQFERVIKEVQGVIESCSFSPIGADGQG